MKSEPNLDLPGDRWRRRPAGSGGRPRPIAPAWRRRGPCRQPAWLLGLSMAGLAAGTRKLAGTNQERIRGTEPDRKLP